MNFLGHHHHLLILCLQGFRLGLGWVSKIFTVCHKRDSSSGDGTANVRETIWRFFNAKCPREQTLSFNISSYMHTYISNQRYVKHISSKFYRYGWYRTVSGGPRSNKAEKSRGLKNCIYRDTDALRRSIIMTRFEVLNRYMYTYNISIYSYTFVSGNRTCINFTNVDNNKH
jgi:hypothetical protein